MPSIDYQERSVGICHIVRSEALPPPRFHYSPAVRVGTDIYVSGLVGLSPVTGNLIDETAERQTQQIFQNLQALCVEQGWSIDRIILARVYCADDSSTEGMNKAWNEFFAQSSPPARTFTVVKSLPLGAAVEIEFQLST